MHINIESTSVVISIVILAFSYGVLVLDTVTRIFDKRVSKKILAISGGVAVLLVLRTVGII